MIEGQEDVAWEDWLALARAAEDAGLEGLFRSDHYLSVEGRAERGSLDAWATLAALAAVTSTLRLGTLVSPATFRHPAVLAKMATTVDHVSGGRAELGLGAGWNVPEHEAYGFPFPPLRERMDLLAEQLEVVRGLWGDGPTAFRGAHYVLGERDDRPKPVQRPGPTLVLGGDAKPRGAALAARFADEYNTVYASAEECRERRAALSLACEEAGRDPASLRFSLMTGVVVGADEAAFRERALALHRRRGGEGGADEAVAALPASWVTGTPERAVATLRELEAAGVERVMLQHLLHEDLETVALLGERVAGQVA
jgi:F420-dependent oxidoreductase-like protein